MPAPTSLVVKNGSKIRCSSSGGTPGPLSANVTTATGGRTSHVIQIRLCSTSASASRAFVSRLTKTCSSWISLPCTTIGSSPGSTATSIWRRRSCSCISESERSITATISTGS